MQAPPPAARGDIFQQKPNLPFFFGMSQKRLICATRAVKYYNSCNRTITPGMMQWDPVLKYFESQFAALLEMKDNDVPDPPKISKSMPVIKWAPAFHTYLHGVMGTRYIPLAYLTRLEDPPNTLPAL